MNIFKIQKIELAILICILVCSGCAGKIVPEPSLETARVAINEANRYEASKYAPQELGIAQNKLNMAKQEVLHKDLTMARRYGEQATIDARYAQVKAQANKAQLAAVDARTTTNIINGNK